MVFELIVFGFFFLFLGNQVVQFRLASCGQDCYLKVWVLNKFPSGGTNVFRSTVLQILPLTAEQHILDHNGKL